MRTIVLIVTTISLDGIERRPVLTISDRQSINLCATLLCGWVLADPGVPGALCLDPTVGQHESAARGYSSSSSPLKLRVKIVPRIQLGIVAPLVVADIHAVDSAAAMRTTKRLQALGGVAKPADHNPRFVVR